MTYAVCGVVGAVLLAVWVVSPAARPKKDVAGGHAVITGGSSGIGLSTAIALAKKGAHVTIMARNAQKLASAATKIRAARANESQVVQTIPADVQNQAAVTAAVTEAVANAGGKLDYLICSAGISEPRRFLDADLDSHKRVMDVNYLGVVNSTRAVLPIMRKQRSGVLCFVSSAAGVVGLSGFTAYSASKFALRGFAEALHMEVRPYNIDVVLSLPPDVDTPLLHAENVNKPPECRAISEGSPMMQPEAVADLIVGSLEQPTFFGAIGMDSKLLTINSGGMAPGASFSATLIDLFGAGLLRLVGIGYRWHWNRLVGGIYAKEDAAAGSSEGKKDK